MNYNHSLVSDANVVDEDGSFEVYMPAEVRMPKSKRSLRIAAWADGYAPAGVRFSFSVGEEPQTALRPLSMVRLRILSADRNPVVGARISLRYRETDATYFQDWINDLISSQELTDANGWIEAQGIVRSLPYVVSVIKVGERESPVEFPLRPRENGPGGWVKEVEEVEFVLPANR